MRPDDRRPLAARVATAATLRKAVLSPQDVVVLAAVEAVIHGPGRQGMAELEEVVRAARFPPDRVQGCLVVLERQGLVRGEDGWVAREFALTPLGVEVLAELIRRQNARGKRR